MRLLTTVLLLSAAAPALAAGFDTTPRLNPANAAEVKADCDAVLGEVARLRTAFEAGRGGAPAQVLRGYDRIVELTNNAEGEYGLIAEVAADDARRDAARACQSRAVDARDAVQLSVSVYQRLKAIDASKLDAVGQKVLTGELGKFDRNGVSRDAATRAKVAALKSRINELNIEFDKNIANGRKTVEATPDELVGLPADYIAAHKPDANGKIIISTDYPDIGPVNSYARSEALRKRLYFANQTRAYPANDAVLREMFAKRDELAKLLGRADFATLDFEDKMVGTPAKARAFIGEVNTAAWPAANRDFGKIKARYAVLDANGTLEPWDSSYVQQLIRKESYSVDPQVVRQYFAYNNVRDGILQLTRDLFGVEIRPWKTAVWDPSVEPYEMLDKGKVIGRFYFDTHPRPGKYNHANVVPVRSGTAGELPIAALVTNFPAGDHSTGLMEHRDVETFLHEYGHLIHGMFGGHQAYEGASWNGLEWDFIEAPSQMLENWVWDYDTLARFAVDKDGKTIPRNLVERMNKARYFTEAYADRRGLSLSNISLGYHSGPPQPDLTAQYRELDKPYAFFMLPGGIHPQAAFGHLGGYSAHYYTYTWSKTIAVDLFSRFQKEGLRNPATASAYRQAVLGQAGSKPAAQLVQDFLGRPLTLDAYKARLAEGQ